MKGVSEIIAEILIVGLAIGLMAFFYQYYSSSTQTAMGNVEAEGNRVSCERLSNFMITNISGNIVSIKNAGGTIINASHFSGFINNVPIQIQNTDILLKPGDFVNIQLGQTPVVGNRVKIIGDCKVGDEFYVK